MKDLELLNKNKPQKTEEIIKILLENRGLETKKEQDEFINPRKPQDIALKDVGIDSRSVQKAITRIKKAIKTKEKIIVYGDYDADGICATAILWETLWKLKANVFPYIPDRFSEGYGLNPKSIKSLKKQNPDLGLIITVDNGVVAYEAVKTANKLGIDLIITDHHQKGRKKLATDYVIHTTETSGAGVSWFFSREIKKRFKTSGVKYKNGLGLAALGTISDQIPLLGVNRSIVKHGLSVLNKTKRIGLLSLFENVRIEKGDIGIYEINYIIAPRINAMGRLKHGIDSLRLLCTTSTDRADELSKLLGSTNSERQKIVDKVVTHARIEAEKTGKERIILVAHKSYHEGVIGLAASKLVEEFYRPSIVISKGKEMSKASARSIPGFNIIKAIRGLEEIIEEGGGHPMAAGFSIKTKRIKEFQDKLDELALESLTEDLFSKKIKMDLEIEFNLINWNLEKKLKQFEPTGMGNPRPTFLTKDVTVLGIRAVGRNFSHLKLKLAKTPNIFDAIAFGHGDLAQKLSKDDKVNIVYSIEENIWNEKKNLQLKVKDIQK